MEKKETRPEKKIIWSDKKRWCGMPITFTKYYLTKDRLFCRTGFLNQREEQVNLYHIRDFSVQATLWQRLFRVGTVTVMGVDKTHSSFLLLNVKHPFEVRDLLYDAVEEARKARGMRYTELVNDENLDEVDDDEINIE